MAKKGDLLVTIKGDATSFDKTMTSSTNQIRKMQQQSAKAEASFNKFGGQIQGLASGALMKFAGAVGAAYTAQEAFDKAIRASQTTSDEFDIVISQAKASVDFFFQSVSTGNWSNFFEGLEGALSRAKTLSIEMDYLGDLLAGWSDIEGEKRTKVQENLAKLYDPSTTKEEAEKLKSENKLLLADLEDAKNDVTKQLKKVTLDTFKKVGYRDDLTDDDLTWYLREASMHKDQEFEEYSEKRAAAVAADRNATQTYGTNWGAVTVRTDANLKTLQKENEELERKWQLNNAISDDERNEIVALRNQERAMSSSIAAMSRTVSRSESRNFGGSGGTGDSKTVTEEILPKGSVAEIDKRIGDLKKEISLEIDPEKQALLYSQLKELEKEKVYIEVIYQSMAKGIPDPISNASTSATAQLGVNIEEGLKGINPWFENYQDNLEKMKNHTVDSANQMSLAFSSIGNILGTISSVSDDSTSRILGGFQTVLGGIGTMITAYQAMANAKKTDAIAGAVSEGASQPFPMNLIAIASGVAAVVAGFAQMSSIPAFADGGIVYGNTIAQVGEYANASSNPEVIAPLSKLKNILSESGGGAGNVQFRIQGKELVGVLDNYSSIKRKR